MKISTKIIVFLIISFFLVSLSLTAMSIFSLLNSQKDNLEVFNNEILETTREAVKDNATSFFLLLENKIKEDNPQTTQELINIIDKFELSTSSHIILIMDTKKWKILRGSGQLEITALLDRSTAQRYLNEMLLTRERDFYLDNYDRFRTNKSFSIVPASAYFRIYDDFNLIVGYGRIMHTALVRIGYIQKKNVDYFRLNLTFFLSVYLLTVIVAVLLSARFMKILFIQPLKQIVSVVRQVAKGDLKVRTSVKSRDEIGDLAAAFNQMTQDLQGITVSRDALVSEMNERRKTEEELKVAYGKLKDTQFQLVQSAKMASVGQLASGVAHEINNPLTGVLNNVQLMSLIAAKNSEFNMCDFKEFLGIIEESALRCKKITQALLDFSHASKAQLQPVSLNDSADRVVVLISHEINLHNITIRKELEPKLPKIKADPQLLEQVILDLVVNSKWAIQKKALPEGGSITIKTRYDQEANQAVIEVIDTGIGIPEENMEKIFEPFFTTKEVGEGTGLGLSLVYGIVTNLNGTIKVESQWGKGATFRLGFPILS